MYNIQINKLYFSYPFSFIQRKTVHEQSRQFQKTRAIHFFRYPKLFPVTILYRTSIVTIYRSVCYFGFLRSTQPFALSRPQALDDWTHFFFFFFFFFLHFHPFGDPYDMFMQLFYLKNLFYQSSINPRLWATIETLSL